MNNTESSKWRKFLQPIVMGLVALMAAATLSLQRSESSSVDSRLTALETRANASANAFYALVVTGTFTDTTSQGVTPIIGNILSDGIIVK